MPFAQPMAYGGGIESAGGEPDLFIFRDSTTGKFFSPDEDSIASCREPGMAKGVKSKKCRCGQCQPYFGSLCPEIFMMSHFDLEVFLGAHSDVSVVSVQAVDAGSPGADAAVPTWAPLTGRVVVNYGADRDPCAQRMAEAADSASEVEWRYGEQTPRAGKDGRGDSVRLTRPAAAGRRGRA